MSEKIENLLFYCFFLYFFKKMSYNIKQFRKLFILKGIAMLELKDICFARDDKKILDNVNLKIKDGKFIVITGPNGGGKSTLAKIIM